MGRIPLQLTILKQILKYNLYLNSKEDSSVVKQSLYIFDEINKKCANSYGYFLQDLLKSHNSNRIKTTKHLTEDNIVDFISALKNKYIDFRKKKVESSTKLDFYGKFKYEHKAEDYLDIIPTINGKRDYTKFRTSNHKLAMETLRFKRPVVPREQRLCEFCNQNEIEDEYHMIFSCKIYADLRVTFLDKLRTILGICPANKDEFTKTIFNTSNRLAIIYTSSFINKCFLRRKSLLKAHYITLC